MWTTGGKTFSPEKPAKVVTSTANELVVEGDLPNMQKFRQTITLRGGVKRIDFKTELIDYKGYNELFTINFPLNLTGGALVTEDRFGTVVRNGSKGFLDFRTNTDKLVSGAPVYSVNNWAEYGTTLTLKFIRDPNDTSGVEPKLRGPDVVASVPFKPTALVRPHGEIYENATETLVSNFIKRGVSITPFYDDNDAARRKNLTIEDSTMPKSLNDDIAYHGFRIALGDGKQNAYNAGLFKLISTDTRTKFDARLQKDGFAYLFLYDKNVPEGWPAMPVLIIAGDVKKATENLVASIANGAFALGISSECFAAETNPSKELPRVPDYGVALINNGTIAVSLENPSMLTMHLTHTATFPGVNLPFDFVPENKTHVFTYSLYPHERDWREADTVRVGYDVNNPLIAVQTDIHDGKLPGAKSFLEIDQKNVVLSALKLGENPQAKFTSPIAGRSLIARVYESSGQKTRSNFAFGFDNYSIDEVDLLENNPRGLSFPKDKFRLSQNEFDITTLQIRPSTPETITSPRLGMTAEPIQPVASRYWMHNMGATPIGNDMVKVSLRPVEQMGNVSTFAWDDPYNQGGITTSAVRVQVVNNYKDRKVSGEVTLEVPEDWRVVPEKIAYDTEPGGSFAQDIVVLAFPVKKNLEFERASGLVKARIEHDGQIFQDVLQIGKPYKLEWRTEQMPTGVTVYIKNPYRQIIDGAVALITPPETWAGGLYSSEPTFSREQGFAVPPNTEIALKFETGVLPAGSWRIARIVYNGNVDYKRADGKTK
ncbi:hypothetical protein BH10ACI2_BH10ACI2_10350 [soil metagenome]